MIAHQDLSSYFSTHTPHLQGPNSISTSLNQVVSIGSENIIFRLVNHEQSIQQLSSNAEVYTAILVHPIYKQTLYLGTQSGKVLRVDEWKIEDGLLLYEGQARIRQFSYSSFGYLGIALQQQYAVLMYEDNKNVMKCLGGHNNHKVVGICAHKQYVCSFGTDGCMNVYTTQSNISNPVFVASYRVQQESIQMAITFHGAFKPSQQQIIMAIPGITTLQQIQLQQTPVFSLNSNIYQKEKIECLGWVNDRHLVIATKDWTTLWKYDKGEKLYTFGIHFTYIICASDKFYATNDSGSIYEWIRQDIVNRIQEVHELVQESIPEKKEMVVKLKKMGKRKRQISIAAKVMNHYPQAPLEKSYESYCGQRYLHINRYGAVVERQEELINNRPDNHSFIELQFHNKSKIRRLKFHTTNTTYCYFAISNDSFLYSNTSHFFFENQKQLKEGFKWDIKWSNIQGVSLSTDWLAVVGLDQIRIFNFGGDLMNVISFDRRYMAITAYQNLLVVVFHVGPPMWDCQSLAMKVYKIDRKECILMRESLVQIQPNYLLKWFGFSEEGMLFSHDSSETVRIYSWYRDEWIKVLKLDSQNQKIYIQNILKYSIYGFKIEQKQGFPSEPIVIPSCVSRRIPIEGYHQPLCNQLSISKKCSDKIAKIKLEKQIIYHQQYRYKHWFKYKYSRNKNHPAYDLSDSILSVSELAKKISQYQLSLKGLLIQCMNEEQYKNHPNKENQAKNLYYLFISLSFTQQCKQLLQQIISKQILIQDNQRYFCFKKQQIKITKIDQIDKLDWIVEKGWYKTSQVA